MLHSPNEVTISERIVSETPQSNSNPNTEHGQLQRLSVLLALPSESLAHITAFLDPPSLLSLGKTNKYLHQHIGDDNTWHRAFICQFLGVTPESNMQNPNSLLLRKPENVSWRKEFISHYNLRMRWERSNNTTITHVPHYSAISNMHLMPENLLLTSSIQYGIVARSLPLTGKILRGYLDASGTGLGIGNPNVEFTPNVSACSLTNDGGTAKILWGFRNGDVAVATSARAFDPSNRSAVKFTRCEVRDQHEGSVQEVVWESRLDAFVTGALDGKVKVWDAKRVRCIWSSNGTSSDACIKVTSILGRGIVVAARQSGDIVVWSGLESLFSKEVLPLNVAELRIPFPGLQVTSVYLDCSEDLSILVGCADHPFFYRVRIDLNTGGITQLSFGDPSFGSLTAIKPIFANNKEEKSFVVVGDQLGYITIYDWESSQSIRKFEAHNDGAVTAIAWSPITLVTGSSHGTVRVFDSLTLEYLRELIVAGSRSINEAVSQIVLEKELIVAAIGPWVMAFVAGAVKDAKSNTKGKQKSTLKRTGTQKWMQQLELQHDIKESRYELEQEQQYMRRAHGRAKEQRNTLDSLGLDENGALEYALMLSRDEEEERRSRAIDDGIFDFDDATTNTHSPASTTTSSPPRTPPSLSPYRMPVSLRFHGEPSEAGTSIRPLNIMPSMPRSPPSIEEFPTMSCSVSSDGSVSKRSVRNTTHRTAWNRKLSPPSPGPSSPPLLKVTRSARMNTTMAHDSKVQSEDIDEDLRFAIELSLAEAHSRGEKV